MINNKIKLIVIDLDGTFLNSFGKVSKLNFKAINLARKKGIKICIATGRNISRAKKIAEKIGMDLAQEYLITLNGGSIYKYNNELKLELIENNLFNENDFNFIFEKAKKLRLSVYCYSSDPQISYYWNKNIVIFFLTQISKRKLIKYDINEGFKKAFKFIISGNKKRILKIKDIFLEKEYEIFSWSYLPNSKSLEINPKGVDKQIALQKIANFYNIDPSEIIYFGDGENDKKAIEWVGCGVAMKNAHKKIKEVANDITLSNKKSGVGHYIKKNILS